MGLSMAQLDDIKQKIKQGLSDRQIAKAVGRRRSTISAIRSTKFCFEEQSLLPDWMNLVDWEKVLKEISLKHPLKFIWEESVSLLTSYSNFTKYLYKKYPYLKHQPYTHRIFNPGERVEVDWAGDVITWIDPRDGKPQKTYIFVSCLGYSQLIFAKAFSSMKEIDFLSAHESMFEFYNGAPEVICPDNTKTAVIKANRYDPDLNVEYNRFTKHYGITVAPARVYSPKDKALVEGAVKLVQRLLKWKMRGKKLTSLKQINQLLVEVTLQINEKPHSRFKISRREMFNLEESKKLQSLPVVQYELCETLFCTAHQDGTVQIKLRYYSVPYHLEGKSLFVKIYAHTLEIFHGQEKVAVHPRLTKYKGEKSILDEHTPPAAQFYRSTNVQYIIQQAGFLHFEFKEFIDEFLKESPSGNLRRAQGFLREARAFKGKVTDEIFRTVTKEAILEMRRFNQVRVERFKVYLRAQYEKLNFKESGENIIRNPKNPMLRKNEIVH